MAVFNDQQFNPSSAPSHPLMAKLSRIPAGRRTKWIILVIWIVVIAAVSPFASKLTDVTENDAAAWLPSDAESLAVSNLQKQFPGGETMPAVIVYTRESGITDADRAVVEQDRQSLAKFAVGGQIPPPIPSQDKQALLLTIPLDATQDASGEILFDQIKQIKATVKEGIPAGMKAKLTGPAGFTYDLVDVFSGIDTTLLLASASVVAILLLITYRSPFVWLIPLLSVAFANQGATAAVYGLAKHAGLTVNGQSQGILPVLVFGAGTDYALLLIARYREELRRHEDKHEAMAFALRRAGASIIASGGTVIIGLLCLLVAQLTPNQSLGLVGACGIIGALLSMLILLPAVLVIFGRRLFWPFIPRYGTVSEEEAGVWARIGRWIRGHARPVWVGTAIVLAIFALGLFDLDTTLPQEDQFRNTPDSIAGQQLIVRHFPAGASSPATIIANANAADQIQAAIADTPGVVDVHLSSKTADLVEFSATLSADPGSSAAFDTIETLRDHVHAAPNADAKVGGSDATSLDVANANSHDRKVVMPLVLLVVLIVLGLLLRSIIAPVLLTATVVLSFAASLGVSSVVFDNVFGFAGIDGSIPLLGFVFLVALGIDYNIFLMGRVHEESAHLGTRDGMLKGLAVTGGVITSAGIVLAATFAVLGVLPLVSMTEMGFLVAFGVLLDTLIVRSILVPALTFDLGRRIWWPSHLSHRVNPPVPEPAVAGRPTVGAERSS
jgi:RND superfamily putative drug exporter